MVADSQLALERLQFQNANLWKLLIKALLDNAMLQAIVGGG
jgi:hypothetical protein